MRIFSSEEIRSDVSGDKRSAFEKRTQSVGCQSCDRYVFMCQGTGDLSRWDCISSTTDLSHVFHGAHRLHGTSWLVAWERSWEAGHTSLGRVCALSWAAPPRTT
jgi:hypothetical protein